MQNAFSFILFYICFNIYYIDCQYFQQLKINDSILEYYGEKIISFGRSNKEEEYNMYISKIDVNGSISEYRKGIENKITSKRIVLFYTDQIKNFGRTYAIDTGRIKLQRQLYLNIEYEQNVNNFNVIEISLNSIKREIDTIIITSSDQDKIIDIVDQYKNITFILVNTKYTINYKSNNNASNVFLYNLGAGVLQTRYLSGILSSLMSTTGEVCYITNLKATSQYSYLNAFYMGGYSLNRNFKIYVYDIETYSNITKEIYALNECKNKHEKADIYMMQLDNLNTVDIAISKNMYVIFQPYDIRPMFGESIIGITFQNWYYILFNILLNKDNNYVYPINLQNQGCNFIYDSNKINVDIKNYISNQMYSIIELGYDLNCHNSTKYWIKNNNYTTINGCLNKTLSSTSIIDDKNILLIDNIIVPLPIIYLDYVRYNSGISIFVYFFNIILISSIFYIFYIIFINKNSDAIQKAILPVLILVCIGNILGISSTFFILGEPNHINCNLHILLSIVWYSLIYSSLFIKTYRIWTFSRNITKDISPITNIHLMVIISLTCFIDISLYILWKIISPLEPILKDDSLNANIKYFICDSNYSHYFIIILFSLNCIKSLLLFWWTISIKLENAKPYFDEKANTYNIFLLFTICTFTIMLYYLTILTPTSKVLFIVIISFIILSSNQLFIFIPIFIRLKKEKQYNNNIKSLNK